MLTGAFESIAAGFSAVFGGPYHAGAVIDQGAPETDDGGSIVSPGVVTERDCLVQGDVATEAMRADRGFAERDIRLLVIGLAGGLTTDATVRIGAGPHAGEWSVQSVERDPAGLGWVARGRAA